MWSRNSVSLVSRQHFAGFSHVDTGSPLGQQVQANDAWVLASQNLCTSSCSPAWICSGFLPLMPAFFPLTVVSWVLVNVHAAGSGLVVPRRMPGRTRGMVDPVSTRARQGWLSSWQVKYSPLVCPKCPTSVQRPWRGVGSWSGGPLIRPLRHHFPPAGWLWLLVLVQGSCRRCDQAHHINSSSWSAGMDVAWMMKAVAATAVTTVGLGRPLPPLLPHHNLSF